MPHADMSTETPSTTPLKKLPMIVDIAIDPSGTKMYQVHELTTAIRKEMPLLTNFSKNSLLLTADDLRSPAESGLGTFLPCLDEFRPPARPLAHLVPDLALRKFSDPGSYGPDSPSASGSDDDNIWSKDVQSAFEEVLAIVPKNGLNKIKIGGKSCGRNELISDYILAKTGKYRLRKQVLSHIQVIKNMGLKTHLILLINDGPSFPSREIADENTRKFEEIFSKINLNKSLGVNSIYGSSAAGQVRRHSSANLAPSPKRRRLANSFVSVKNICFSIENMYVGSSPILLTSQTDTPMASLTVKENAAISNRFPGLEEFSNTAVPVIHNMVKIFSPLRLPSNFSIDNGLKTNYMLDFSSPHANLSSFTTVYSFGNDVLKVDEKDFQVNTNQPFLLKFWKCFFLQLLHLPPSLDTAFKGITVKQVIYDSADGFDSNDTGDSIVPKNKVRAVLLWEFSKVNDLKSAVSTTLRLFLPPTLGYATTINNSNYYKPSHTHYTSHFSAALLDYDPMYSADASLAASNEPDLLGGYHNLVLQSTLQPPGASFPQALSHMPAPQSYYPAQLNNVHQMPYLAVFHPLVNVDLTAVRGGQDELQYAGPY